MQDNSHNSGPLELCSRGMVGVADPKPIPTYVTLKNVGVLH